MAVAVWLCVWLCLWLWLCAWLLGQAVTCVDKRWMVYCGLQSMIKSAREMDPSLAFFEVAESCFFRYSVAVNSRNARAWLNLALVHQCITGEYVELVVELVVGWWWYC